MKASEDRAGAGRSNSMPRKGQDRKEQEEKGRERLEGDYCMLRKSVS